MNNNLSKLLKTSAGAVWKYFSRISSVPRPSGNEDKIRKELISIAQENNWKYKEDLVGNLVIYVLGKGKFKKKKPVILQGHMDMVCEKSPDKIHDFYTDSISLKIDGDYLKADMTTLGADNGMGMSLALALAEGEYENFPPLELLFTVDEERGFTGALGLDASLLKGQTLVNLDSDQWGVFVIGCAGGMRIKIDVPLLLKPAKLVKAFKCTLEGFEGGHSGTEIHLRENPIIISSKIICELRNVLLHSINGGNKMNAIPRDCVFVISGCDIETVKDESEKILKQVRKTEKNALLKISEIEHNSKEIHLDIIKFISTLPNGVIEKDKSNLDIILTSSNLGIVKTQEESILITLMPRFVAESAKNQLFEKIAESAKAIRGNIIADTSYPAWKPEKTKILQDASELFYRMFGFEPEVKSIHAGLETGVIAKKTKITQMLSFSPTIKGMHSPNEKVDIKSVDKVFVFLQELLKQGI